MAVICPDCFGGGGFPQPAAQAGRSTLSPGHARSKDKVLKICPA
ncbi:hypothetical protein O0544_20475 [Edwardsiella anguillarum]|uniref:Uncharacterized protein n=1 Tax=Edwardsiella anguillarum ET080813 TaxID=667120 RepID=A0A076LTS3_9GAMM|nr:Hypothetical protein ETEE_3662 [Edwardsiella anguillarum ET080813]MDA6077802.1 hypothetical protein [Edwardsiella anguillarum]